MDKMYCKDESLSDSLRRNYMSDNYKEYNTQINQILYPKMTNNITINQAQNKIPEIKKVKQFQVQGINSQSLNVLKTGIANHTMYSYSSEADVNYIITFENSGGLIQNSKDERFYYAPEGRLIIKINGNDICGDLDPSKFKIAGVSKPGNTINKTKEAIRKQINNSINDNQQSIIDIISNCIK